MRRILFVNQSTLVKNAELQDAVAALQIQLQRDVLPAWGLTAQLMGMTINPAAAYTPQGTTEVIRLLDTSDQAGALGYHELQPDAVPEGFVFVEDCKNDNVTWSSCASHELLEQLLDPLAQLGAEVRLPAAFGADAGKLALVAYEVSDPVEADGYMIAVGGGRQVEVSNFILPDWFLSQAPTVKTKYDFLGKLTQPLSLTPGGYVSYSVTLQEWTSIEARGQGAGVRGEQERKQKSLFSRQARRHRRHRTHAAA